MLWLAIIGAVWLAVWAVLHLREQSSWEAGAVDQTRVAPDVLAGGVLFWLILGFFWRTVSGDVYQPADGGDLVSFLFPTYRFAAQQLSQGVLPLWNPHLYGGAPFISDIQAGFFYPVNVALFLLRPDFDYTTMQWLAIGHLYWAGLGVYVLLRVLRPGGRPVARLGALLGGLAFALGSIAPLHLMCDPRDIGVVAEQQAAADSLPTITVYEKIPAGIGFSQRLYEIRDDLLRAVEELVRRCPCERGCPACVGPVSEEADEAVDAKALTVALVEACRQTAGDPA